MELRCGLERSWHNALAMRHGAPSPSEPSSPSHVATHEALMPADQSRSTMAMPPLAGKTPTREAAAKHETAKRWVDQALGGPDLAPWRSSVKVAEERGQAMRGMGRGGGIGHDGDPFGATVHRRRRTPEGGHGSWRGSGRVGPGSEPASAHDLAIVDFQ